MKSKNPKDFGEIAVMAVDIDQDTFHLVGVDHAGQRVLCRNIWRLVLKPMFERLPRCDVGMEACMRAHFVSRMLPELGVEPRIIPVIYMKPFNKAQKKADNDAEAIAEAALHPNLCTVPEKSPDQLDLQAMHRDRSMVVHAALPRSIRSGRSRLSRASLHARGGIACRARLRQSVKTGAMKSHHGCVARSLGNMAIGSESMNGSKQSRWR